MHNLFTGRALQAGRRALGRRAPTISTLSGLSSVPPQTQSAFTWQTPPPSLSDSSFSFSTSQETPHSGSLTGLSRNATSAFNPSGLWRGSSLGWSAANSISGINPASSQLNSLPESIPSSDASSLTSLAANEARRYLQQSLGSTHLNLADITTLCQFWAQANQSPTPVDAQSIIAETLGDRAFWQFLRNGNVGQCKPFTRDLDVMNQVVQGLVKNVMGLAEQTYAETYGTREADSRGGIGDRYKQEEPYVYRSEPVPDTFSGDEYDPYDNELDQDDEYDEHGNERRR